MAATLFLVLAGSSTFAEELPNANLAGRQILRIEYQRSNVFDTSDPATSSWPYRWANALHITTRETFIRSMILFSEGEAWDPAVAAESARILRSLDFLNPVFIDAYPEAEGVIVRIRTHDKWTLQVGAKFGIQGSRKAYSIEFDEKNFLSDGADSYTDWSVTLGYTVMGVDLAVAYVDTDLNKQECFANSDLCGSTAVFSISKSL